MINWNTVKNVMDRTANAAQDPGFYAAKAELAKQYPGEKFELLPGRKNGDYTLRNLATSQGIKVAGNKAAPLK